MVVHDALKVLQVVCLKGWEPLHYIMANNYPKICLLEIIITNYIDKLMQVLDYTIDDSI